jgi:D-galactarolactone cycloisomerase
MKIIDVKAFPLIIPMLETPPLAPDGRTSSFHLLVKVFTDEEIVGYGETFRFAPRTMTAFVDEILKPLIVGKDPLRIEQLWRLMYTTTFRYGRAGLPMHAISGVEVALWDILGKYRSLPLYELLGGACRDKVRAYASLQKYDSPGDVATIAVRSVERGYKAVKLHQRDVASVAAARQAVGPDISLMMDASGAWSFNDAVSKVRQLEPFDLGWIEEPLAQMDDYDGLAELRRRSGIPIAAGENEYTVYGFRRIFEKRALDIVQPDVIKAGGIAQCRRIIALAEAHGVRVAPHSFYYGPGIAATLHLCASSPSAEFIEINALPLTQSFIQPALRPQEGVLGLPSGPGLGIEIDDDVVRGHPGG